MYVLEEKRARSGSALPKWNSPGSSPRVSVPHTHCLDLFDSFVRSFVHSSSSSSSSPNHAHTRFYIIRPVFGALPYLLSLLPFLFSSYRCSLVQTVDGPGSSFFDIYIYTPSWGRLFFAYCYYHRRLLLQLLLLLPTIAITCCYCNYLLLPLTSQGCLSSSFRNPGPGPCRLEGTRLKRTDH
ncbi:hypothetical protein DFP73DRAFT_111564 [Morchella snyderi]|nr:hypothetical protein DFP73DRAFT_111564 [Morchella snyderi]